MLAAGFPESQVAAALGFSVEECLSYEKGKPPKRCIL
jgi:hypothetical protein